MNHSAAFWAEVERQLPGHAALRKRLVLIVNEKDEAPDHEGSERRDAVRRQGETRVERAENFVKAATSAAQSGHAARCVANARRSPASSVPRA